MRWKAVSMDGFTGADVMMVDAVSVAEDAGFQHVVDLVEQARVSAVSVVDGFGRVLGIITATDLRYRMDHVGDGRPPVFETRRHRRARDRSVKLAARELMSAPAVTASPDTPLRAAVALMHRHDVRHLPVVDELGCLLGLLVRAAGDDEASGAGREPEELRCRRTSETGWSWRASTSATRAAPV